MIPRDVIDRIRAEAAGRPIASAYYRVSADPSQGGRSRGSQRTYSRGVSDQRGWYLPPELEFGETQSASIFGVRRGVERGEWAKYLEVIKSGLVQVAILPDVYRGMREFVAYQDLIDACGRHHVMLNAEGRDFDLGRESDSFSVGLDVLRGAGEATRTSDRVKRGVAGSIAEGRPPVGRVPMGYVRPARPLGHRVYQVPDPVNARLVKAGARYILATGNLSAVARRWTKVTGHTFTEASVRYALRNPALIGRRTVSKLVVQEDGSRVRVKDTIAGNWEPILDARTHYALQELFSDPSRKKSPGSSPTTLCSSIVKCGGRCGTPVRHQRYPHNKKSIYSCARGCVTCTIEVLDIPVGDAIRAILAASIRDDIANALREDLPAAEDDTHGKKIEAAKAALKSAQQDMEDFSEAAASSGLKPAAVVQAMVGYSAAVDKAETALKALAGHRPTQRPSVFFSEVREYVDRMHEVLETLGGSSDLGAAVTSLLFDEISAVAAATWDAADLMRRREWVREELDAQLTSLKTGRRFQIVPKQGWAWVGEFRPLWSMEGLKGSIG